ncbi:TolC family protein [Methylomarinum sp. Ch1-1]|uniref:TolC family protein n=1 Tax=Methylomarinum roseum TaxID=3067653 RepID=A0AAU7NXP8_9GAMM|nr:TolC family protein [Methylomarinum sp. Ch1-1]MDP4522603.1 TolC family protein [Methylomarinum sp. Ch1-1]
MKGSSLAKFCLPLLCLTATPNFAENNYIVEHVDPISIDVQLTLPQVIEQTLAKYPDRTLNQALQREADALKQRGDSWLAGSSSLSVQYLDDVVADDIGYRQISGQIQVPLWNWNQRSAGEKVAEQAQLSADKQVAVLKLQVAGLVRAALWDLALENIRYQQSKQILDISEKLLQKIRRRVDLGDLPRSDYLLAKSDYLQKRSLVTQAEAKVMHARKNYSILTGMNRIPENYTETLSEEATISDRHPLLQAVNAQIERKQAELHWVKSQGSGQPNLQIGMQNERDQRGGRAIQSAGVGISIPFGGKAFLQPQVEQANIELTQGLARREHLYRQLEKNLHEAEHALEVDEAELAIANEMKEIAERHLKMIELSFAAGEINLLDLLKIQAQTHNAIRHAKEHEVQKQRHIAFYNQAVGVQP